MEFTNCPYTFNEYSGNFCLVDSLGPANFDVILVLHCTHIIKFHGLMFRVFDWQENPWGINFGGVVGTIVVEFAKYASCCGLIYVVRGMPRNSRKFMHLKNFCT